MFVVAIDEKKGLAPTPIIWLKTTTTETGYYWPRYGLHFKLKNYSPLPVDSIILKNEWRYVPCKILFNGSKFKTCKDAEKAISEMLMKRKGENIQLDELHTEKVQTEVDQTDEMQKEEVQTKEVQTKEVQAKEVQTQVQIFEVQTVGVQTDEVQTVEVQTDEVETVRVQTDEVQTVTVQTDEVQPDEAAAIPNDMELDDQKSDVSKSYKDDEIFLAFPLKNVPTFKANEGFLKNKNRLTELNEFYNKINENLKRKFFDRCVEETFSDNFFLADITFKKDKKRENKEDFIGVFDGTRLYKSMKKAVVEKLKLKDLDDTALKQIFINNFERIRGLFDKIDFILMSSLQIYCLQIIGI